MIWCPPILVDTLYGDFIVKGLGTGFVAKRLESPPQTGRLLPVR